MGVPKVLLLFTSPYSYTTPAQAYLMKIQQWLHRGVSVLWLSPSADVAGLCESSAASVQAVVQEETEKPLKGKLRSSLGSLREAGPAPCHKCFWRKQAAAEMKSSSKFLLSEIFIVLTGPWEEVC